MARKIHESWQCFLDSVREILRPLTIRFIRNYKETIDVRTCVVNYWVCLKVSGLFRVCKQINKKGIMLIYVPKLDIKDQSFGNDLFFEFINLEQRPVKLEVKNS